MNYISTRGREAVSSGDAILKGIAPDGGLYVPSSFPIIGKDDILALAQMDYHERAAEVLSKFLTDFTKEELQEYTKKAYSSFDGDPAGVLKVDDETYILELTNGRTLAFKDMALSVLPYLVRGAEEKAGEGKKTLILVATSGDTGKAAIESFAGVKDTEVIVFYPSEGVSAL
ncbi:MAG: threonine synthase, partial [Clostridia bacterium]